MIYKSTLFNKYVPEEAKELRDGLPISGELNDKQEKCWWTEQ